MMLMRFGMLLKATSLFGRQFHVFERFYGLVLMSLGRIYVIILMRFGMLLKAKSLFGRQFHVFERFYGPVLIRVLMVLKAKS